MTKNKQNATTGRRDVEKMNQIERIQYFEEILDKAKSVLGDLEQALENYYNLQVKIKELEEYYDSPIWMSDYHDDEEGKLPPNLKRGVLSEDEVYNILNDNDRIYKNIFELASENHD